MALTLPRKAPGQKPWVLIRTKIKATDPKDPEITKQFVVKWGSIPAQILPSIRFRILAQSDNCSIITPWNGASAPNPLASAGLGGFSLLGAGLAISQAGLYLQLPQSLFYGLSGKKQEYPPTFSYCINDVFSERTYLKIKAIANDFNGEAIVTEQTVDVHQRYKSTRYFVVHGEIASYSKNATGIEEGEEIISFGINKTLPMELQNSSTKIKIIKRNGSEVTKTIKRFLPNFNAVVDAFTGTIAPEAGDFYILEKALQIDDTFLQPGIFLGKESHYKKESEPISEYDFEETTTQKFYTKTRFVGGYYLKKIDTQETLDYSAGASFDDTTEQKWQWVYFSDQVSSIYGEEVDRFSQKRVENIYEAGVTQQADPLNPDEESKQKTSSSAISYTYDYFLREKGVESELKLNDSIRLEISECGGTKRNNFHSPMLANSFIRQGDNYFKILAQLDGVTVDVNKKSVNGKAELDIHSDIEIIQQYGWKTNEHYSNSPLPFGHGKVDLVNGKSVTIKCAQSTLSEGTVSNQSGKFSKQIDYLPINSFYKRILSDNTSTNNFIKMYSKGEKWKLQIDGKQEYNCDSIVAVDSGEFTNNEFSIQINLSDEVSLNVGDRTALYFDEPTPKNNEYNGGVFVAVDNSPPRLCVEEEIFSPFVNKNISTGSILGVCEDYLIGVGISNSEEIVPLFWIQVPEGFLSVSTCYSKIPYIDGVIYRDPQTSKITLRSGTLDFTERPEKIEITIGKKYEEDLSDTMNSKYDRLHAVRVDNLPSDSSKPTYLTFASKFPNNRVGFQVSGNGKIKLGAFERDKEDVELQDISSTGSVVSPIYIYKSGTLNQKTREYANIGIDTKDVSFYINEGLSTPINISGKAYYSYENQSVVNNGASDMHILGDGERLFVYGSKIIHPFKIGNSINQKTTWAYSNSVVMITGSYDAGKNWGTPYKKLAHDSNKWSLPILVMHSCEYLCSFVDEKLSFIGIFTKNYDDNGRGYIGFSMVPISILTQNLYFSQDNRLNIDENNFDFSECKDYDLPFWTAKIDYSTSTNKNWGDPIYVPKVNKLIFPERGGENPVKATFRRVIGPKETQSDGLYVGDTGLINCYQFNNGIIVLLHDSPFGVEFAYSNSGGEAWEKSSIVLARNAKSGFIIDRDRFFYLSPSGIATKPINEIIFEQAIAVGKDATSIEKLQKELDDPKLFKETIIGGGNISEQRFSGYKTAQGVSKIFFYDSSSNLSCLQSIDGNSWEIASNF